MRRLKKKQPNLWVWYTKSFPVSWYYTPIEDEAWCNCSPSRPLKTYPILWFNPDEMELINNLPKLLFLHSILSSLTLKMRWSTFLSLDIFLTNNFRLLQFKKSIRYPFLFVGNSIKYNWIYFQLNWFFMYFISIEYVYVFYLRWQSFVIYNSYNKNSSFLSSLFSIMQSKNFFSKNLPEDIFDIF